MNVINVVQKSQEWHDWRETGLTATCASVIMGKNPYQTPWRLWAEKTGMAAPPDLSANPHVRHGVKNEDNARKAYEEKHSDICIPACVQSKEHPFILASLDGLNMADEPVELKCPSQSTWDKVKEEGELSAAYSLYWYQVQHQMLACGADTGWLVFWRDDEYIEFQIKRDDSFLKQYLVEAKEFWEKIQNNIEPEKDPEKDIYIPEGNDATEWAYHAEQYKALEAQITALKEQIKNLQTSQKPSLDKMKEMMGDNLSADYAGVLITNYSVKGRVNYKKMAEEEGISEEVLKKYLGKSTMRTRVTVSEDVAPRNIVSPAIVQPAKKASESRDFYF